MAKLPWFSFLSSAYLQDLFSAGRFVLDFKESFWKQRALLFFEKVSVFHQTQRALKARTVWCLITSQNWLRVFISEYLNCVFSRKTLLLMGF
jgi:hypothetical protein